MSLNFFIFEILVQGILHLSHSQFILNEMKSNKDYTSRNQKIQVEQKLNTDYTSYT